MGKVDISIIIVTYNSEDTITDCVESIIKTVQRHSYEIIISDNSQTLLTRDAIRKRYSTNPHVFFIKNQQNLGFSKGNNIGIKKAKGSYVLFLNPDTIVYEQTIDGMTDFMKKHPECGAATCTVKLLNGHLDDASHRGFPTPWRSFSHFSSLSKLFPKSRLFGGYNLSYLDHSVVHEIEVLAGSFMIVPYHVGKKLSWWDEDYFFYGEDIDFCYRIKKAGYKIYFVPTFEALHMKGISSGIKKVSKNVTKASNETKKLATYHRFHAMEIFYNKHYKKIYPKYITFLVMLGIKARRMFS